MKSFPSYKKQPQVGAAPLLKLCEVSIVVLTDIISLLVTPCLCSDIQNNIGLWSPLLTKPIKFIKALIDPSLKVALLGLTSKSATIFS